MKKILIILVTLLALNVNAQSDLTRGHSRGEGLYISWSGGLGMLAVNDRITEGGSTTIKTKGGAGGTNIRIGTAVKDDLLIHADILAVVTGDIRLNASGDASGVISDADNIVMRIYALGTSYYFMPSNFFISGSLGLGTYEVTANIEETTTEMRPGLIVKAGKDWWIAKSWDMGVSFEMGYLRVDQHTEVRDEVLSGLALLASFNITFH